jgi:hypothetical protein
MINTIQAFRYSSCQNKPARWNEDYQYLSFTSFYEDLVRPFHKLPFPERLQSILLLTSGRFKCRDDRDRLYAVLGIAGGVKEGERRMVGICMEKLAGDHSEFVTFWLILLLPTSTRLTFIVIWTTGQLLSWMWSMYFTSITQSWAISRHEYVISEHKRVLDALRFKDTSRAEFFTILARYLAKGTGNLSFINAASCCQDPDDTMPSWVPTWSREVSPQVAFEF